MHVMDLQIRQRPEFRVGLAHLLLAELIALPVAGLRRRLDAELEANLALELPAPVSCDSCGLVLWRGRCAQCRPGGKVGAPLSSIPARRSTRAELLSDAVAALGPDGLRIGAHLLADIDEHGLLAEPLPVIAARLGCAVEAVQRVIRGLRVAGSPGLCAPSLGERLALQVAAVAVDTAVPDGVDVLLSRGLQAVAAGDPAAAATASGLTRAQVDSALAWLRAHLSPDIIDGDHTARPAAPVDIVVRRAPGGLVVEPVTGPWSAVRVAPTYLAVADDPRVRPEVARATRFVAALGRREQLLTRVCTVVLDRQSARVTCGPKAHRALSRRDVATAVGVHESTVSRVVAGKHVLLPSGETIALATLFGPADDLRQCLRDLVAGEPEPQSDAELARALAERGHVVARRTIAKYRAELGIPRQRNRKGERDGDPGRTAG